MGHQWFCQSWAGHWWHTGNIGPVDIPALLDHLISSPRLALKLSGLHLPLEINYVGGHWIAFQQLTGDALITVYEHTACTMQRLRNNIQQAQKFKKFRPSYPASLYESIYQFLASGRGARDTAVDVSCGSVGERSTSPLTSTFRRVIAVDVNRAAINQVRGNDQSSSKQVNFGQSTDLSFLRSGTVDLVTVAQAYHWLDRERFLRQVNEALAPNGVLAVHGYGNLAIDNPDAFALIFQYYTETLRGFWESERRHVDTEYKHFTLPLDDFTRRTGFRIEKSWPLSGLIGYISTQTASRVYIERHGLEELEKLYSRLLDIYGGETANDQEPVIKVTWPAFLLLGRKS